MGCKYCSRHCVKTGVRNGIQKFKCRTCRKYQQQHYRYAAYQADVDRKLVALLKEGIGMRSISRILTISVGTVIRRIKKIASLIKDSRPASESRVYEIDEIWTYIGNKTNEAWITYAFCRESKDIVTFTVGPRTKLNLQHVVNYTLDRNPLRICTDGLNTYIGLVPPDLHHVGLPHTRTIERFNLNLRTHLK